MKRNNSLGASNEKRPLDPRSPNIYFEQVQDLFKEAQQNTGHSPDFFFQVNGCVIRMIFAGDSLYPELTRVFAHLRTNSIHEVDLTVFCWDGMSTSSPSPWTPIIKNAVGKENDISYFNNNGLYFSYNHTSGVLNILNVKNNIGLFWIQNYAELPLYEKASALKNILNWWFYQRQFYMVHAAAVGIDDRGVLIAGKGRTGKSTTAMTCFENGMKYAGDDYVLLSKGKVYRAYSLYNAIKLENNNISRFFKMNPEIYPADRLYKKMVLHLSDIKKSGMSTGFQICALLIPAIQTRVETGLQLISPGQAFRDMAPSSLFQQMGAKGEVFAFLAGMARKIPCYRLTVSRDISQIPMVIEKLIQRL
jgi:hypothetical protein